MASSLVQAAPPLNSTGSTQAATAAVTFGSAVVLGDIIVFGFTFDSSAGSITRSVADGLGNFFTEVLFANDTVAGQGTSVWVAPVTVAGTSAPTVTLGASHPFRSAVGCEYSGVSSSSDTTPTSAVNFTTGNPMVGASITPASNGETIFGLMNDLSGTTFTASGSWAMDTATSSAAASLALVRLDQATAAAATPTVADSVGTNKGDAISFALLPPAKATPVFIPRGLPIGV